MEGQAWSWSDAAIIQLASPCCSAVKYHVSNHRHNGVNVGFKPTVRAALSIPVPYDPDALIWLWQYLPAL